MKASMLSDIGERIPSIRCGPSSTASIATGSPSRTARMTSVTPVAAGIPSAIIEVFERSAKGRCARIDATPDSGRTCVNAKTDSTVAAALVGDEPKVRRC